VLDHRVPLKQRGAHSYENVQTACRKCNAKKAASRVVGQLPMFAKPTELLAKGLSLAANAIGRSRMRPSFRAPESEE
jgi:hypothetical protein